MSKWIGCLVIGAATTVHAEEVMEQLRTRILERAKVVRDREELADRWESEQLILRGSIDAFRSESERLKKAIAAERKAIKTVEMKHGERAEQADELRTALDGFERRLASWEKRIQELKPGLPPKLRRRLREIETGEAEVSDALSLRLYRAALSVRTIEEFNKQLVIDSELWEMPDGSKRAVTVVYFGLAQAYFTDAGETHSGIGSAVDGV